MVALTAFKESGKKSEDIENPVFPAHTTIDPKTSSAFDDTPKPVGIFEVMMAEALKSQAYESTPLEKEKLWRTILTYTLFPVYSLVHHARFRGYTNLYIFPRTMFTYWHILIFHLISSGFIWGGYCGVVMVLVALVSEFCFGGGFVQQEFQSLRVMKSGLCRILISLSAMAVLAWAALCFPEFTVVSVPYFYCAALILSSFLISIDYSRIRQEKIFKFQCHSDSKEEYEESLKRGFSWQISKIDIIKKEEKEKKAMEADKVEKF